MPCLLPTHAWNFAASWFTPLIEALSSQHKFIQCMHSWERWHISCFNRKACAKSFFSTEKFVRIDCPCASWKPKLWNKEAFKGFKSLLAQEGRRELDALKSNRSPGSGPVSPLCLGLLHIVWGSTQIALFPNTSCMVDTQPSLFFFQSSSSEQQPTSLSSHYGPHTLQALWSYWILPRALCGITNLVLQKNK